MVSAAPAEAHLLLFDGSAVLGWAGIALASVR
jgi:hypothetical protein